jgi:hypothetical protein
LGSGGQTSSDWVELTINGVNCRAYFRVDFINTASDLKAVIEASSVGGDVVVKQWDDFIMVRHKDAGSSTTLTVTDNNSGVFLWYALQTNVPSIYGEYNMGVHMDMTVQEQPRMQPRPYTFYPIYNKQFYENNATLYCWIVNWYWEQLGALHFMAPDKNVPSIPFVYATYALEEIFKNGGYGYASGSFMEDEEIQKLTIYNTRARDQIFKDSTGKYLGPQDRINLAEHLPDIPVKEYLLALKNLFCLGYFFDKNGNNVEVIPLKEVLSSRKTQDWTGRISRKKEMTPASENKGYLLEYEHDSSDGYQSDRLANLFFVNVQPSVATFSALPASGNNAGDVRLVTNENVYYRVVIGVGGTADTWEFHSENLYPLRSGDETYKLKPKASTLCLLRGVNNLFSPTTYDDYTIPRSEQAGNTAAFAGQKHDYSLRFLFYRGFQPSGVTLGSGTLPFVYPFASYDTVNHNGGTCGNYSLRWDGEKGLYNVWHRQWIDFMNNARQVEADVHLTPGMLQTLRFQDPIRDGNQEYILAKLSIEFDASGIGACIATMYQK